MLNINQDNTKNLYFSDRLLMELGKISNFPLTIIEAPMGYGKTTAVKDYLKNMNANVLWQTVYDGFINSFWNKFCKLFEDLNSKCSTTLLELGLPNDSVSREYALELITDIQFTKQTFIVIDDYYLIDHTDIHNFITFLAKNEISNFNIIIITRLNLISELDELKLKGYAYHIDKDMLELHLNDIGKYFKSCGITLSKNDINKLYMYTEGWISALYLLMLEYIKNDTKRNDFEIINSVKSIYTLLEKSIYLQLPEKMQNFLTMLCIFDYFTFEQAEFIWERKDTCSLLIQLIEKNVFLTYDITTKKYQMHNILKDYLNAVLEKKNTNFIQELYLKSARWFLKIGDYFNAMNYFYKAKDFDNMLKVYEDTKGMFINFEQKYMLKKYFADCPKDIKLNHPVAALIYILNLFVFNYNEIDLFKNECHEFIQNVKNNKNLAKQTKLKLEGEFEVILSFTKYNSVREMSVHHKRAEKLLNGTCSFINTEGTWTFGSPSVLYLFYRESGKLQQFVTDMMESMPYYYRLSNNHGYGAEYIALAEMQFYTGDYENAEINAYIAEQMSLKEYGHGIFLCVMFLQIRLATFRGNFDQVISLFKKMHKIVSHKNRNLYTYSYDICEAYVYAYINQKDRIPLWISNGEINTPRILFQTKAFLNITYGRVLLVNGEYLKLIGISKNFIQTASVFSNLLGHIYTYIYMAAANKKIHRDETALDCLKSALDIAMPDKLYMPFIENCDYIKSLLEQLQKDTLYEENITKILQMYNPYAENIKKIRKEHFFIEKPKLTKRETEIVNLAAEGLTNKEIGEKLFISTNTVKSQLKNIFDKLGIKSRSLLNSYVRNEK